MQQPVMPSSIPSNMTTEQIQKCLDDNKKLILAILENQNLGKLAECAQYQTQLQKNLMYLAAIADAQPQAQTMPSQMVPHPAMHHGGFYMQHPQAAAAAAAVMAQQPAGIFSQKVPPQFSNQQTIQRQMVIRPVGAHSEAVLGGGPLPTAGLSGGNKQDASEARASGTDGGGDEESSYLKGSEEAK